MAFLIFRAKTVGFIIKESFKENLLSHFRILRMISVEAIAPTQNANFSYYVW